MKSLTLIKTAASLSLLCSALLAGNTMAQSNGFYVGASAGSATFESKEFDVQLPTEPPTTTTLKIDDDGTTVKVFAGYRFGANFAVEGDYTNFANYKEEDRTNLLTAEVDVSAISLSVVGILPLADGMFDLFARLGASWGDFQLKLKDGIDSPSAPSASGDKPDGTQTDLVWSLGAQVNLLSSQKLGIRAEYTGYEYSKVDTLRLASVGVSYRF